MGFLIAAFGPPKVCAASLRQWLLDCCAMPFAARRIQLWPMAE
jgi:hypothetical protein